jgi:hypothetical protein
MKECSTPPSEAAVWYVYDWRQGMRALLFRSVALTAWRAWEQCEGAPAFGSCRVEMAHFLKSDSPPKPLTERQKRDRAREAIIQPKTAENRRR